MKKKVIVGVLGSLALLGASVAGVVLYRNKKAREEFNSMDLDDLDGIFDDSEGIFSDGVSSFDNEFNRDFDFDCSDAGNDILDELDTMFNGSEDTLDEEDLDEPMDYEDLDEPMDYEEDLDEPMDYEEDLDEPMDSILDEEDEL